VGQVKQAAIAAQHFDSDGDKALRVPDQFIDLGSFAAQLQISFAGEPVAGAAATLQATLAGTWQYGAFDRPWTAETQIWDFRDQVLGLNIFFPDPDRRGIWDWRSPYYLSGVVDPTKPPAHRHVIDFLADKQGQRPPWVEFIVEYHRDVKLKGFLPALAPVFPVFNARFKATLEHPRDDKPGPTFPDKKDGRKQ
jgi:hypothetical protein